MNPIWIQSSSNFVGIKMCCCHVDQCCCGCTDHKTGVIIWGVVDVAFSLIFLIIYAATIGIGGPQFWTLLMIIADILLILGAWKSNTGLLMVWQIIAMIMIVLLFVCWLAVPILLLVVVLVDAVEGVGDEYCQEEFNTYGYYSEGCLQYFKDQDGRDALSTMIYFSIFVILVLPFVYIYFWIVVNSLRHWIMQQRMIVIPITQQPQMMMVTTMPPVNQPYNNQQQQW